MPVIEIPNVGNIEFPDSMSRDDISIAIRKITKAPTQTNKLGVPVGEGERIMQPEPQQPRKLMDYISPIAEVPATLASGAALALPSPFVNPQKPLEFAGKYAYKPQSPVSQDILSTMGKAVEGLPPYLGGGLLQSIAKGGKLLQAPTQMAVEPQVQRMAQALRSEPTSTMSGVGAAEVPKVIQRSEMAQNLRVPVPLTKGQMTRDLGQQAFEAETPKNYPEIAQPLVKKGLEQNEKMLQNFDAFVDATGAQTAGQFGLRPVGKVVDKALVNYANDAWKKTGDAYTLARESGEMQSLINYQPLQQYINQFQNRPTLKSDLAKIIGIVEDEIKINDPKKTGKMSINQLEDIYELINKTYDPETASATYAVEMKKLINNAMEGQGGELYQKARQLRTKYANEFENVGYVDKLLRKKPGTKDRAVAFEDIFDHAIMKGSLDDVMAVGRTLKKAGPEGQQAWKELQGQTIEELKSSVTKNIKTDAQGNRIVSPARFDSFVRELDQDGKLDYLFGKPGAQEIRNLRDTSLTIYNKVDGAVNYSNSASAFIRTLDTIAKKTKKIPLIGGATDFAATTAMERALKKQVEESINFDPKKLAEQLRKE